MTNIFRIFDSNEDGFVTKKEFRWMTSSSLVTHDIINCVFQVNFLYFENYNIWLNHVILKHCISLKKSYDTLPFKLRLLRLVLGFRHLLHWAHRKNILFCFWNWLNSMNHIQRYDEDANGKLDFAEFSRMIESHRARFSIVFSQ